MCTSHTNRAQLPLLYAPMGGETIRRCGGAPKVFWRSAACLRRSQFEGPRNVSRLETVDSGGRGVAGLTPPPRMYVCVIYVYRHINHNTGDLTANNIKFRADPGAVYAFFVAVSSPPPPSPHLSSGRACGFEGSIISPLPGTRLAF